MKRVDGEVKVKSKTKQKRYESDIDEKKSPETLR